MGKNRQIRNNGGDRFRSMTVWLNGRRKEVIRNEGKKEEVK